MSVARRRNHRSLLPPSIDLAGHRVLARLLDLLDAQTNATAANAVATYDLATGERLSAFNFAVASLEHPLVSFFQRWVEVDPKTRTGLAFGPLGKRFRRFSY
jgi:hypothetical protein